MNIENRSFSRDFWLKETDLSPPSNPESVVWGLKLEILSKYPGSSNKKAGEYLKLCTKKIRAKKQLSGSSRQIINRYKDKIDYALERDKLLEQDSFYKFQQHIAEAVHHYSQDNKLSLEMKAREKEERKLEEKNKFLQLEHRILKLMEQIEKKKQLCPPPRSFLTNFAKELHQRSEQQLENLERKACDLEQIFSIENQDPWFENKEREIEELSIKVEKQFETTFLKEKELETVYINSLQRIKEIDNEIEKFKGKIKDEPSRLRQEYDPLDGRWREEISHQEHALLENLNIIYHNQIDEIIQVNEEYLKKLEREETFYKQTLDGINDSHLREAAQDKANFENQLKKFNTEPVRKILCNQQELDAKKIESEEKAKNKKEKAVEFYNFNLESVSQSKINFNAKEKELFEKGLLEKEVKKCFKKFENTKTQYKNESKKQSFALTTANQREFRSLKQDIERDIKNTLNELEGR